MDMKNLCTAFLICCALTIGSVPAQAGIFFDGLLPNLNFALGGFIHPLFGQTSGIHCASSR